MDLTSTDILLGIGALVAAACVAGALYWALGGFSSDADANARHRVPEELLRGSTYRLSADRVARARVPHGDGPASA